MDVWMYGNDETAEEWKSRRFAVGREEWKIGGLEDWRIGGLEDWKSRRLEEWMIRGLED